MNTTIRLMPIAAAFAMLLVGCQQTPAENAKNVSEARQEAASDVADARKDADETSNAAGRDVNAARKDYNDASQDARVKLSKVESEAMTKTALADYDIAVARADGAHAVAIEKCGVLTGVERDACQSTAEATHQADLASAVSTRDAALVRADWHE